MKKALIDVDGGRVVQVEEVPPGGGEPFPVAPGLRWVDAPEGVDAGDLYDERGGGTFARPPGPPLEALKAEMISRVKEQAEAARLEWISDGSGQALVYMLKKSESEAFLADESAVGPLLQDEAARRQAAGDAAATNAAIAGEWRSKAEAWQAAAVKIERVKFDAIDAIHAAADAAGAATAASGLAWPTPGV